MKIPKVVAHRGGRIWAPENTLAAFRKSLELGVDGIELDIRRCATGELVIMHGHDLKDTTDGAGLVTEKSWAELKALSAGKWFDDKFAGERIPLLSDVLDLIAGKTVLHLEIKVTPIASPGIEKDIVAALRSYAHRDKLVISCFDHQVLKSIHELDPQLEIALLAACRFVDVGAYARLVGAKYFNAAFNNIVVDEVKAAHAAGLQVNVWTLNQLEWWRMAMEWGVDGIISDDPEQLKAYLSSCVPVAELEKRQS